MPLNNPKVSILLSSYNHEDYIAHAINSALAQTFQDFELLIYDDASTDDSVSVIRSFSDPRIHILAFPTNGKRATFMKVLPHIQGEYVAMLHSDDAWTPDKLARQVAWLDTNPNCGAVFTLAQAMNENGGPVENTFADVFQQNNRSRWEWLHELFTRNVLCHPSVLIRTELYRETHTGRAQLLINDWRGWIKLCLRHDIHVLQEKLTWFRIREAGLANNGGPTLLNQVRTNNEISFLLELYRELTTPEDWIRVFPEAASYVQNGRIVGDYALARICIATNRSAYIQFGLHLLAAVMDTEAGSRELQELYGFTGNDYLALCSRYNFFSEQPSTAYVATLHVMNGDRSHEKYRDNLRFETNVDGCFHIACNIASLPEEFKRPPFITLVALSSRPGVLCRLNRCEVDGRPLTAVPVGAQTQENGDAFYAAVPIYEMPPLPSHSEELVLNGKILPLSPDVLVSEIAKLERYVHRMAQRLRDNDKQDR